MLIGVIGGVYMCVCVCVQVWIFFVTFVIFCFVQVWIFFVTLVIFCFVQVWIFSIILVIFCFSSCVPSGGLFDFSAFPCVHGFKSCDIPTRLVARIHIARILSSCSER